MKTDLTWLLKFTNGDAERAKKYVAIFLEQIPVFVQSASMAFEERDAKKLARSIHSFKAQLLYFGLSEGNKLAIEIEKLCDNGNFNLIGNKLDSLITQCKEAETELKNSSYPIA